MLGFFLYCVVGCVSCSLLLWQVGGVVGIYRMFPLVVAGGGGGYISCSLLLRQVGGMVGIYKLFPLVVAGGGYGGDI